MITELVPLVVRRLEDSLVMTRAASGARASPARFFARAVEQYYLAFESLVNSLHQVLVFERFCEKGESSPLERGLAH
jgi:hypothetical protein